MAHELNLAQHTTLVPCTLREVLKSEARDQWLAAMHNKVSALIKNDTFELVDLPLGRKAVSTRWVLTLKATNVYKARWVA